MLFRTSSVFIFSSILLLTACNSDSPTQTEAPSPSPSGSVSEGDTGSGGSDFGSNHGGALPGNSGSSPLPSTLPTALPSALPSAAASSQPSNEESPQAILLLNNEALYNLEASSNRKLEFVVLIPNNTKQLSVQTNQGTGYLKLSLYDSQASPTRLCESSNQVANQATVQSCNINNPAEGEYKIVLAAESEFSGVRLMASYELNANDQQAEDCNRSTIEQELLNAHNQARASERQCGGQYFAATGPLTWNCKLFNAAQLHSQDMADKNYFDHTNLDGEGPAQRAQKQGYNYNYIGENIAAGQQSVSSVMQGWLNSPGHCANIMNPNYSELGSALVDKSDSFYRLYWTAVFGRSQ
ncbi:CAP domain-containing protein [Agaribacterium sp. ZY112]|uniref:CAP domain-containing protein n=1 Tax=Agaribacterium sp. ZY112 TaxID=3233574 RepID=UPI003525701A